MSQELYRHLIPGYDLLTAKAHDAAGAPSTAAAATPAGPPELPPDEVPFLTPELLAELREQLTSEPELTLQIARRVLDADVTLQELQRMLDEMDATFKAPAEALVAATFSGPGKLPADFYFEGMETDDPNYAHRPLDRRYEDHDAKGYVFNGAAAILKRIFATGRKAFRWHNNFGSQFHYKLADNSTVALFADYGTGLAHCWYTSKFMKQHLDVAKSKNRPTVAIHLGDVYYAGRRHEAEANFNAPLKALVNAHELWNLAGNHDYYSGGHAYFEGIDARREVPGPSAHRQEGSYFCLESSKFVVLAIDVEYHTFFGLHPHFSQTGLKHWMEQHISAAKTAGKSVILLSSDQPYSICSSDVSAVYKDVTSDLPADAIDFWFWGNTHYCAIFDHSPRLTSKFYGSCIGHGGFPYETYDALHPSATDAAPYRWAETEPRFPKWTEVRPDMGNAGFVIADLDDTNHTLSLNYYDWTNDLRATVKLNKQGTQLVASLIAGKPRSLRRKPAP